MNCAESLALHLVGVECASPFTSLTLGHSGPGACAPRTGRAPESYTFAKAWPGNRRHENQKHIPLCSSANLLTKKAALRDTNGSSRQADGRNSLGELGPCRKSQRNGQKPPFTSCCQQGPRYIQAQPRSRPMWTQLAIPVTDPGAAFFIF